MFTTSISHYAHWKYDKFNMVVVNMVNVYSQLKITSVAKAQLGIQEIIRRYFTAVQDVYTG